MDEAEVVMIYVGRHGAVLCKHGDAVAVLVRQPGEWASEPLGGVSALKPRHFGSACPWLQELSIACAELIWLDKRYWQNVPFLPWLNISEARTGGLRGILGREHESSPHTASLEPEPTSGPSEGRL